MDRYNFFGKTYRKHEQTIDGKNIMLIEDGKSKGLFLSIHVFSGPKQSI